MQWRTNTLYSKLHNLNFHSKNLCSHKFYHIIMFRYPHWRPTTFLLFKLHSVPHLCIYMYIYIYIYIMQWRKNTLYLKFQNLNFHSKNLCSHKFYHIIMFKYPHWRPTTFLLSKLHSVPCLCVYMYIYMCVYIYKYIYIYNAVKNKYTIFKIPEFKFPFKEFVFS